MILLDASAFYPTAMLSGRNMMRTAEKPLRSKLQF